MSTTIDLAVCLHCDARMSHQERQDGWCANCGKRVSVRQELGKAATSSPVREARDDESEVEQSPEEICAEVCWAVVGWTLLSTLTILGLALLTSHANLYLSLAAALITLTLSIPLSYYLAGQSRTVRLVGVGILTLFDLVLNLLSLLGNVLSCLG